MERGGGWGWGVGVGGLGGDVRRGCDNLHAKPAAKGLKFSLHLHPSPNPHLLLLTPLPPTPLPCPIFFLPHHYPPTSSVATGYGIYLESGGPGFHSRFRIGSFFRVESHQWLQNWHSIGSPCQAPGVIGSALRRVGPVSV